MKNPTSPPAWADRLLTWFCPPYLLEELLGDLHEQFAEQSTLVGEQKARRLYLLEVLKFCRPYFLVRRIARPVQPVNNRFPTYPQPFFLRPDMLQNYLKIAFRTLWKSKSYAAINVFGLSIAFCICTFLFLTVYRQLTFDSFHNDGDRIFRPYFVANDPKGTNKSAVMPLPLAPALKTEFPEAEGVARMLVGTKSLIEHNGKYFDKLVGYTDPDLLTIFSFPLAKGNTSNALSNLSNIVISQNMANDIFGSQDPIGKPILLGPEGNQQQYIVSGVTQAFPENSTIMFDALVRIETKPNYSSSKGNWGDNSHSIYLKLSPNTDQATVESRLKAFTRKYFPTQLEDLKKQGAKPDDRGDIFAIRLQQLADVHFDTDVSGGKGAPIVVVYALLGLALFILLIACINFINLSIARSFTRAREVGVRKSLGALKRQLFAQIWGESVLICSIGFGMGLALAYTLSPGFNATFDAKLNLREALQPGALVTLLGIFALVTLVAGGYPAWKMARFNAVEVLKGKVSLKGPGLLRNSLIVTQFAISSFLICSTIIALQQIGHLRSRPLGFQKEQVISIPVGTRANGRQVLNLLRAKLTNDPGVLAITGSGINLGRGRDRVTSRTVLGFKYKDKDISSDWVLIDYDYLKTLQIKLLAGREFSTTYATDSVNRVIITESMAKQIGEAEPVGKYFKTDEAGAKYQIIGLIPDFHLYSIAEKAKPITMHLSNNEPINYIFVRVAPQSLSNSMDKLQHLWEEIAPGSTFMASFLDENVDAWYKNEEMLTRIFSLSSGIAILLSCMGLFAVALLVIEQRTKEIGVRKVMGASITSIVLLLSRDFVKLVLIALAIAVPLAWFSMQQWLNNYAERIQISLWVFIGVGLAAILIALATVGFQSIKAALINPIKSLRSE